MPRVASSRAVSRRGFIKGMSLSALAVGAGGLLSGCGTPGARIAPGECPSTDKSAQQKEISFSNWTAYIDPIKGKGTSTLERFEQQAGIDVHYDTDVNSNDGFFAKVSPQLQACQSTGRDVFVLTDFMAARMVDLGWLQKLDHANMPNVGANLLDSLKSPTWDPGRDFSVPWQSGMTGICYNADLVDPVTSFTALLTRSDLKGKITLLSDMRDTMTFLLLMTGSNPSDFTDDEFSAAVDELQKYLDTGQIRRFTGNDYIDDLKQGNVVACAAYSGDIPQLGEAKFKWVAPEEGFALWSDNMLVPNKAEHKANVERLINFYYDPVNAAQLAAWNYYFCPVKGALEQIAQFDDTAVDNPLIFPDDQLLQRGYNFMGLNNTQDKTYQLQFNQVLGG